MNKYFNIVILIIILIAVFLARQPFSQKVWPVVYEKAVKTVYEKVVYFGSVFISKGKEFFQKYILSRITGEIETRKEVVKEELEKETEKITESIWQKIKNFFLTQFKKMIE